MALSSTAARETAIPAELTAWVTWFRAGAILWTFALVMVGYHLAHRPIHLLPAVGVASVAFLLNALLAEAARRAKQRSGPAGDRVRVRVLYAGGFLDTIALSLVVLFTGGFMSPWLYFFLATSIVSSVILPPGAGRVLTAVNALAAVLVIFISVIGEWPSPPAWQVLERGTLSSFALIVGFSLISLMWLTAYAVSVPVESARAAVRLQQGLAEIALTLQRARGVEEAVTAVCAHARRWFGVDRALIMLLEGEELVVTAAEGPGSSRLLGRRTPVSHPASLDVEVLRRRDGLYVNNIPRSAYAHYLLVEELGDRAILLVPLIGTFGVFGVLSLANRRRSGRFTATMLQRAGILAAQTGVAVENARLLDRVREEADSVTALLAALERLTKSHELSALLTEVNRIGTEMAGCNRSATFLWDPQREVFYFGSMFGAPPESIEAMRRLEFARNTTPIVERILAGETCVVTPATALTLLPSEFQLESFGASAIVPLLTEDTVQGAMTLSYVDPERQFTSEQLWMLRGIARYAALAVERARLMAQEREAAATAEALVTLGRDLSARLDRRQALDRIPEMAATAAGVDFAALAFWDRDAQKVRILGAHGFLPGETEQVLQLSLDTQRSALADAALSDGHFEIQQQQPLLLTSPELMKTFRVSSLFCSIFGPVDRRMAILAVGYRNRTGPFSTAQKRLIDGIAQQAAVVLENTRLVEDLRRANRLKSDFLSTMSHELRTPLNAIIGYGDLLREQAMGPLYPEQQEALDVISKKSVQLLELINATLDVTRLESGQVQLDTSEFTLPDLLAEIRQDLADEVPPLVEFRCLAAPLLPLLHTDRLKLKTVIKNLAHNALKFTRRGYVEVRAEPTPNPSFVRLVVSDTGIGIADDDVKAIFEMFRQIEPAMTRRFSGVGLGLYIVQRLLDLVGGTIEVKSQIGVGSTFTAVVPVRFP
ncbi:MAG: GAF domain-containing protein [Candidatus Binatia bacterium]